MPNLTVHVKNNFPNQEPYHIVSVVKNTEPQVDINPQESHSFPIGNPDDSLSIWAHKAGNTVRIKCGIQFRSDCDPFQSSLQKLVEYTWKLTNFSSTQTDVNVSAGPDVQ